MTIDGYFFEDIHLYVWTMAVNYLVMLYICEFPNVPSTAGDFIWHYTFYLSPCFIKMEL